MIHVGTFRIVGNSLELNLQGTTRYIPLDTAPAPPWAHAMHRRFHPDGTTRYPNHNKPNLNPLICTWGCCRIPRP